jgi:hypothetical protein
MKKLIQTTVAAIALGVAFSSTAPARADEPHMRAALEHLRMARHELEVATPNKGGHRERAMEHLDQAIHQTEDGIRFAEMHH